LLVNPIRDGLNLVAKEGPLVNERDAPLLLSPEAGAWEELAGASIQVEPYDIDQTAEALHNGLSLEEPSRADRASRLRALAGARSPADWFDDLIAAAG
jgi:trehalose 6-phosphate synthase